MAEGAWPPKEGVSTPTVSVEEGVFAITGSVQISAPAPLVFDLLLDTSTYPEWCTFVPKVVIDEQPSSPAQSSSNEADSKFAKLRVGTKFTFFAVMGSPGSKQTPTHLIISDISTPSAPSSYIPSATLEGSPVYTADLSKVYRVAWKGDKVDFFAKGLNTERFHEVIIRDQDQCEVRTWEVMGGVLAHAVKYMYKKTLSRKFQEWCEELKGVSENIWAERRTHGAEIRTLYANADAIERQCIQEQLRDVQREIISNFDLVWSLGSGHMQWALIQIGLDLNIFTRICANPNPTGLQELVAATSASPTLLARLLRSMASFGFIVETAKNTFTANRITRTLAHPDVVGAFPHVTHLHALTAQVLPCYLRDHKYQDMTDTENLPFHMALNTNLPPFEWMKQHPEQMKALGHAMRIEQDSALLVDIGGGFGQQAAAFKAHVPSSSGRIVVQDVASTLAHAPTIDGIDFQEHDFFTPQPIRGAKFYYLRHILHDWTDEDSVRILQNLVPALTSESRIAIDEVVLPETKVPWQCAFMDLTMSSSLGGRERSRDEWDNLLNSAGLQIEEVHTYDDVRRHSVIIAVPKTEAD
ncbi:O-methyltransferase [Stagonosporopsis vannaccii]|nr:O-methyltransferase [Stagonosporopsis vannaccii]